MVKDNLGKVVRVIAKGVNESRAAKVENGVSLNLDGAKYYTVSEPEGEE